jgi:hypothetical protein
MNCFGLEHIDAALQGLRDYHGQDSGTLQFDHSRAVEKVE